MKKHVYTIEASTPPLLLFHKLNNNIQDTHLIVNDYYYEVLNRNIDYN